MTEHTVAPATGISLRSGVGLALVGALILTPDALFMRLSGMDGLQMLGWRGICMGTVFLIAWSLTSTDRVGDLIRLGTGSAVLIVLCQAANALLFPLGIAAAPVAPVLIGVATAPIWSAILARVLHGEPTSRTTWLTIAVVLAALLYAVTDKGDAGLDAAALTGLACGLGVAVALALNFVTLRHHPRLPLLLAIGLGALAAGIVGWTATGPAHMMDGTVWAILVCGIAILPLSFFALSQASRHTAAANVGLLMLLETVLGPLWVWLVLGETPGTRMLTGGAVVVSALALYLVHGHRRRA
ncbi:DMT family transporter [Citreimonas sp.]|uniref:DMT family transporter n=1 Tax=Citreimonas sp. TaxID=3036715 RepID=UPI0035C81CB5